MSSIDVECKCGWRIKSGDKDTVFVATIPGTRETEKQLHAKFGPYWVRGELFRPEPELLAFVADL